MHLLFPPLFTWSFLCSEGTVFLWITIFYSPGEISAISSRSSALVHSSKLEQCPYFVFHVCVQDDLGCGTSFIFALRALSRQVISLQVVPDCWGGPAHPIFIGVKHSVATQKETELEESIQYVFSLQAKTSPVCSKDYTRLSKVCMIHFAGGKILKKKKKNTTKPFKVRKPQSPWC